MNIRTQLIGGFTAAGLIIFSVDIYMTTKIETTTIESMEFHGRSLQQVQSISAETFEAIQESLAYLISGDSAEKDEFQVWLNNFQIRTALFQQTAFTKHNDEALEKNLFTKLISQQKKLARQAEVLFTQKEMSQPLNQQLFTQYETIIDEFSSTFKTLIEIEQSELKHAENRTSDLLKQSKISLYILTTLTLFLLGLLAYFISIRITSPLRKMAQAVTTYGKGDKTPWPVYLLKDEVSELGNAFGNMIKNLDVVHKQKETLIQELQNSLAQVKQLQGIIPICAYCKKIRDDQGSWSQLEVYINQHSEADFSHGICPECKDLHFQKKS